MGEPEAEEPPHRRLVRAIARGADYLQGEASTAERTTARLLANVNAALETHGSGAEVQEEFAALIASGALDGPDLPVSDVQGALLQTPLESSRWYVAQHPTTRYVSVERNPADRFKGPPGDRGYRDQIATDCGYCGSRAHSTASCGSEAAVASRIRRGYRAPPSSLLPLTSSSSSSSGWLLDTGTNEGVVVHGRDEPQRGVRSLSAFVAEGGAVSLRRRSEESLPFRRYWRRAQKEEFLNYREHLWRQLVGRLRREAYLRRLTAQLLRWVVRFDALWARRSIAQDDPDAFLTVSGVTPQLVFPAPSAPPAPPASTATERCPRRCCSRSARFGLRLTRLLWSNPETLRRLLALLLRLCRHRWARATVTATAAAYAVRTLGPAASHDVAP